MNRVEDVVAVVTGGTGGIGRAIARRLLDEGAAAVVITGRDERRGARIAAELGSNAYFLPQDVTDEKRWTELLHGVVERFGRLDALVNNAGWAGSGARQDPGATSTAEWRDIMAVNLDAVFMGCREAMAVMAARRRGAIVNVSSTAGLVATPSFVAYGAAKAAVGHLTRSVAVHCARTGSGVRCNSVHPSLIDTAMSDTILRLFGPDPDRARQAYLARVPMGELGTAADVADAVLYLVSDESRYVTGAELVVSGGLGL